ncbi:MAG: helix-turn-helix domain-containing protein [Candidatus Poribacteria bacterium]|nr:helix-turn-helix domain-containing protein [Candidatus Poribacteria bacterium]
MTSRWLSLTEAAKVAQTEFERAGKTVSRKTVSRWARDGKVNAERRDERWYVDPDSLRQYVDYELTVADATSNEPCDDDVSDEPEHVEALRVFLRRRRNAFLNELENGVD